MPLNLPAGAVSIQGPLAVGSRGQDVRVVQEALNRANASLRLQPDGAFGIQTDAAVRAFQRSNRLKADGIVGPLTAAALGLKFSARPAAPPLPAPGPPARPRSPLDLPVVPGQPDQNAISQLVEAIVQGLTEIQNSILRKVLAIAELPAAVAAEIRSRLAGPFQAAIQTMRNSVNAAKANLASAANVIAAALRSAVQGVISAIQDIASLIGRLPDLLGLTTLVQQIQSIVGKVRRAVDGVIDLILRTLGGAGVSVAQAVAAIVALLRGAAAV